MEKIDRFKYFTYNIMYLQGIYMEIIVKKCSKHT